MTSTVPVQSLRVGMFVHLDLGWMQHPFALSSFRITSPDQIETIRGLGLHEVRWDPEQSAGNEKPADVPPSEPEAESAQEAESRVRREALASQRAATQHLDRQCNEAARALREAQRQSQDHPVQARTQTEALTQKLVAQLLGDGEMCIRLLGTQVGDRAAAHGLNVAVVALLVGRGLGLGEAELMDLGVGAMLHDIGKLDLPDRVRHPDDSFTTAETNAYRDHVARGVQRGRTMGLAPGALAVLAQHHEHVDGSGFPLRPAADKLMLAGRIVAIVNRYDNLCNPAVLAHALTPHEAISMLFAQSRHRFDATVLGSFIRMMGVYPAGSCVELTDGRHALVIGANASRPLKPRVLVHDPRTPRDEALFLDLETAPGLGIRRSVLPKRLPAAALEYLAPRPRLAYFFEPAPAREDEP